MVSHKLLTTFAIIFGNLTLGFYVAIQGPTMVDLIDMLHVNTDIMSYSVAFSSLAYSVGGLLGGLLFNYFDRTMLIALFYLISGVSSFLIPFMTNFIIFSVINVLKMMCAGGTDCGANVWVLELWPGHDEWLQALHFTFAVGCALGPLVVEPFLSADKDPNGDNGLLKGQATGNFTVPDQQGESRIYIPYCVSGTVSAIAAILIVYLDFVDPVKRQKRRERKLNQISASLIAGPKGQALIKPLLIPLTNVDTKDERQEQQHNNLAQAQLTSADLAPSRKVSIVTPQPQLQIQLPTSPVHGGTGRPQTPEVTAVIPTIDPSIVATPTQIISPLADPDKQAALNEQPLLAPISEELSQVVVGSNQQQQTQQGKGQSLAITIPPPSVKITSRVKPDSEGKTPFYVMLAIALAAMCLSSYCGVEITSMNFLATFVINIDLQIDNRKSTAALMSSALTISFAVGRGIGIYLAKIMKPHKLFYFCIVVMSIGNVCMLLFANTVESLLWVSICLFGAGCGPMFPSIVSFFDDKISKVTNTISGIFILGSMFNVALNSLIIGHHIIDNALILINCNLVGTVLLCLLFGTLHALTKVKKAQRVRKYKQRQQSIIAGNLPQQQLSLQHAQARKVSRSSTPTSCSGPAKQASQPATPQHMSRNQSPTPQLQAIT